MTAGSRPGQPSTQYQRWPRHRQRLAPAATGRRGSSLTDSSWDRLPGRLGLLPHERARWHEFAAALRRAIEEDLSEKQRRVFTAVTLDDVPVEVLAAGLGSSRNAIYKALFEARRTLRARLAADAHVPAHRSGNATACPRWAHDVLAADPGDAGCDLTFQLLDRYVETGLRGPGQGQRFPAVTAHLRSCPDCHQDCQGLQAARQRLMPAAPGS